MFRINTPQGPVEVEVDALDLPPTFPIILPICRELEIREVVDRLCPMHHHEALTHGDVFEMLALHILQEQDRKPLFKLEQWAGEHNVNELYDCQPEAFNDDRIGRALDAFSKQIPGIETELVRRAIERFKVPIDAVHWDLTNVTFTGVYDDVPDITRGYGNGRMHDKQLKVSLHTSHVGAIPLRHEIMPGGAHQAPLASPMLKDLRRRLTPSKLLIISDRAGISYDNMVLYDAEGVQFLGPMETTPDEDQFVAEVADEQFVALRYRSKNNPECVYSCYDAVLTIKRQKRSQPIAVRGLVIHSTARQQREADDRRKRVDKALRRLEQINGHLNKARYCHEDYAREQLAKAVPDSLAAIVHYELTGAYKRLQLRYWIDDQALASAGRADGRWLMVTNDRGRTADELFELQRGQYDIEARFRNFGHDLAVQPVWLHKQERIRALLLVFIIALMVYCLLELCAERAKLEGDHYHKMTARQLLYRFSSAKIVRLCARGHPPTAQLVLTVDQKYILSRLGFPDAKQYILSPVIDAPPNPQPA
jgi:transposase